jgi:hypothetical protein
MKRHGSDPVARLQKTTTVALNSKIRRFYASDFSAATDVSIRMKVGNLADGFLTKFASLVTNGVFRARINPDGVPFSNARELWYPPTGVIRRGRFNEAEQQRFYVTDRANAAVLEVRPKVGDHVTVLFAATIEEKTSLDVAQIGLHHYSGDRPSVDSVALRQDDGFLAQLERWKVRSKWEKIDDVFSDFSTRAADADDENALYRVTNAIGELMEKTGAAGLMYPSIEATRKAVNLCLNTDIADALFFPGEAWQLKIVDWKSSLAGAPPSATGYYGIQILAQTGPIPINGELNWYSDLGKITPADIDASIRMAAALRAKRKSSLR